MGKICFVIMGYGKKTDPTLGKTFDLDKTYYNIIKPAIVAAGYECIRGDEVQESGLIDCSIYGLLIYSDLAIADIRTFNPNAIYELGVRLHRRQARDPDSLLIAILQGRLLV